MTKLPILSAREILTVLRKLGFAIVGQKGSHIKLKKISRDRNIVTIVPNHKTVMRGTLKGILELAEIKADVFLSHL